MNQEELDARVAEAIAAFRLDFTYLEDIAAQGARQFAKRAKPPTE